MTQMSNAKTLPSKEAMVAKEDADRQLSYGKIDSVDRIQRLIIGSALMLLTLTSIEHLTWRSGTTLFIQADLLLTGFFGWCPVYWTCRSLQQERGKR